MDFRQALKSGKFLVTAEIGPGKGTETAQLLEDASIIKKRVDAINVTDQQSSVMRLGSLACSHLLRDLGIDSMGPPFFRRKSGS